MEKLNIGIHLDSSNEIKFIINTPEEDINTEKLKYGYLNVITPNSEDKTISITSGIQYLYDESPILECHYSFTFKYEENVNGCVVIENENEIKINQDILNIILSVAIGAIRGIMIARTIGTNISKYPLPIIGMEELLQSVKISK